MKKTASALGVAIIGFGSSFLASPAMAHTLADCGTAPAGGTITLTDNVCQLTFSAPGTYNFTTPKAVAGLAALLVGGGGGADWIDNAQNGQNAGYAGSGGKVTYVDLSSSTGEDSVAITIGAGGSSSNVGTPNDGSSTTMTIGSTISTAVGGGKGIWANAPSYCYLEGANDYTGVGDGAAGQTPSRAGEPCRAVLGINPAFGAADSAGVPAPQSLAVVDQEFGAGGRLIGHPNALPTQSPGAGADVLVSVDTTGLPVPVANDAGANGFAAIVWQLPKEPKAALADTGSGSNTSAILGLASIAVGAALVTTRRRWAK